MPVSAKLGDNKRKSIRQKLADLNWFIVMVIVVVAGIGFAMLYSVAGGSIDPWAKNQFIRFLIGLAIMIVIAVIDIRVWMFLAYPFYILSLAMLVVVDVMGAMGKGSQRWLDLGVDGYFLDGFFHGCIKAFGVDAFIISLSSPGRHLRLQRLGSFV